MNLLLTIFLVHIRVAQILKGAAMNKEPKVQICFTVLESLRSTIKARAAIKNISMNLWLMRAIYHALKREDT